MEFTEICDYQVGPGLVTEWTPAPAGSARPDSDPRPPSYLQEAHFHHKLPVRGAGMREPSWLAVGFDLPGPLEPHALRAAVLHWVDRHETLRSGFRLRGGEIERFTVGAGDVTLREQGVGEFNRSGPLVDHLREFFDRATDLLNWPAYALATVSRAESSTVCIAFDHSNVDGYSILLVPHEIRELYEQERAGSTAKPRPSPLPSTGSYVDFCQVERERTESTAHTELVREWEGFLDGCGGTAPEFPLATRAPGEQPVTQGGVHRWMLDADDAAALDVHCRGAGGSAFSGALLALTRAVQERSPEGQAVQDPLRTLLLLHTRSSPEWARSVGWYVSLGPLDVAPDPDDDLAAGLQRVHRAVRRAKELSAVPHPRLQTELSRPIVPKFVVSYMDMRPTPGSESWHDWNAQALHAQSSATDEVYLWINRSAEGIYLTCRYPGTDTADRHVRAFSERVREALRDIATGSPTAPADCLVRLAAGTEYERSEPCG